jgi:hypothetical protein
MVAPLPLTPGVEFGVVIRKQQAANRSAQGNPKRWAPWDEAQTVSALAHESRCWRVACDIWNLDWDLGPLGKCCLEKNSKMVNQVANPANYFFVSPFVMGRMEKRKAGLGQRSSVPIDTQGRWDTKSGLVCAWSAGFEPTKGALEDGPVRAGSAHAAVPEEEACVRLNHPERVATGASTLGHGVVDVAFGGGIGRRFHAKAMQTTEESGRFERAGG